MTEKAVQNIYNKLFNWEGRHALEPYPIHKKLDSKTFGYIDIYEWISKTYSFSTTTEVLDAGCGVGYGSIYLSKQHGCKVTGISLSNEEVKKANLFAKNSKLNKLVGFHQKSFDILKPNSFDFIMAIESVKHTLDIDKTLASLKKALKPNGILVIVDDFLVDAKFKSLLKKYSKDWALKVILKHNEFEPEFKLKKDLTPFVITKTSASLLMGTFVLSMVKPFFKIASIMRGGLYLEKLFKQGVMKYYALEYKKPENDE